MSTQTVTAIARLPEADRYPQELIYAQGEGGTMKVAALRAIAHLWEDPRLKRKTPNWMYIQVVAFGMNPISFGPWEPKTYRNE